MQGVLQQVGDGHLGGHGELRHDVGVVGHLDAVVDDGLADGVEGEVALGQGLALRAEDLAEVFDELVQVEDAVDGGGVIAGAQDEVVDGGVADDEVAAFEVEDGGALVALELRPMCGWVYTYDLQGHHRRIGQRRVGDQVGAVFPWRENHGGVFDGEAAELVQRWVG